MSLFVIDVRKNTKAGVYDEDNQELYVVYNTVDNKFKHLDARTMRRLLATVPQRVVNACLVLKESKKGNGDYNNIIRGKTGSFDKFTQMTKKQRGSMLRPEFYTVINYYDWNSSRYFTTVDTLQEVHYFRVDELSRLIREGVVINAKIGISNKKYFICGINWKIPLKDGKQEINQRRDNVLFCKVVDDYTEGTKNINWEKICRETLDEVSKYFRCIYSGRVIRDAMPATTEHPSFPTKYDTVPCDEFEREFISTGIEIFKRENNIEGNALSPRLNKTVKYCLLKFSKFQWPIEEMKLNAMMGIFE